MAGNINFETNNNGFDIPNFDYNIPASPIKKYSNYDQFYLNEVANIGKSYGLFKCDLVEEIQKYHMAMLDILNNIREYRNQYEYYLGKKFIDGMEEVCVSELDQSVESLQKINKLINEFKVSEKNDYNIFTCRNEY